MFVIRERLCAHPVLCFLPITSASTWNIFSHHEDGGSTLLRNVGRNLDDTARKTERRPSFVKDSHLAGSQRGNSYCSP